GLIRADSDSLSGGSGPARNWFESDGVRADQEIGNNRAAILEWPAIHLPLGSGADGSCWREVRLQGANQSIREIRNSIAICVIGIEQLQTPLLVILPGRVEPAVADLKSARVFSALARQNERGDLHFNASGAASSEARNRDLVKARNCKSSGGAEGGYFAGEIVGEAAAQNQIHGI